MTTGADILGPAQRKQALSRLRTEEFDVVVVGGGVTGAGAALDAVTRGLRVALVEQRDWAAGTSSRSGKLFHGGLRYLEKLDFGLVREALRERALMLRTLCPHLVRPVQFLYPLEHRVWERAYVGAGVLLYDTIGGAGAVPRHRHLTKNRVGRIAPGLRPDTIAGAVSYYDVQVDDARHTLALVRTAAAYGAVVVNAAKVVGYERDGERVTGVRVLDAEAASVDRQAADAVPFAVRAKAVVHAAGVWTDDLQELLGGQPPFHVTPSKGVHLVVPRDRIRSEAAILVRAEDSVLLIRPWFGHWILGTTDTPWAGDKSSPAATSADIDYLLRNANRVLDPPLTRDDIDGVYAGLRPLVTAAPGATSNLSREHTVATPCPGLAVVAGGKYTTYRVMARDVVDAAAEDLQHLLGYRVPPSVTQEVPLLGAAGWRAAQNRRESIAATAGIALDNVDLLLRRHGALITQVLDELTDHPELAAPVPGGPGYLLVEARFAATHEGALHLEDVLARRTHLSVETHDRGLEAAEAIAPVLADALGWDSARTAAELDAYRSRVAAEIASQRLPDDAGADAARLAARDPRVSAAAPPVPPLTTGGVPGVVFDLDGVLLDSEHLWEQSWTEVAADASYAWTPADTAACQGMSTHEWAAYLADRTRRPAAECAKDVVDRVAGHYRAGDVELLPGALEMVTETAARVPVAMASSAPRRIIDTVLDTMGLRGAFSATVSSEEVARGKPNPDVYAAAARRLGLDPGRSFAVDDTSNGVRAAAAAGLGVIAVPGTRYALAEDAAVLTLSVQPGLAGVRAELQWRLDGVLAGAPAVSSPDNLSDQQLSSEEKAP